MKQNTMIDQLKIAQKGSPIYRAPLSEPGNLSEDKGI